MKDKKITFRPVTEDDFDEILRLEEESFNRYDRLDRETLVELYSEFRDGFYALIEDGVIAGYCEFLIEKGAGYIESIAIDRKFRRRGLGVMALRFMIERITELNLVEINLHVRTDNIAAVSLYEKEGFVKKSVVKNFYKDGEPAYLYMLKLDVKRL